MPRPRARTVSGRSAPRCRPLPARTVAWAVLLVGMLVSAVAGAQTLTVDEAVDLALEHAGIDGVEAAAGFAIAAQAEADTVHPVPRGFGAVEATGGDVGVVEVTVGATWVVDPSGWRARARDAAADRAAADAAERQAMRDEVASEVRHAFWQARAWDDRLAAWDLRLATVDRTLEVLRARYERGDVARYAVVRVESERAVIAAERVAVVAERDAARAEVLAITGAADDVTLVGALRPGDVPPLAEPPMVRARAAEARAWDAVAEVAARPALRDWELEAGYRMAHEAAATGHGGVVALSIPLGGRAAADAARASARAQASVARAEQHREGHLAQHERAAALARLAVARDAIDELAALDAGARDELVPLAESAWAAGEAPLSDVIEAWRAEAEVALLRVDLEWAARDAMIDLEATGLLEDP